MAWVRSLPRTRSGTARPFPRPATGRFPEADLLRWLFETAVRRCMADGLVGGEGFAVDASLIVADAIPTELGKLLLPKSVKSAILVSKLLESRGCW
jgi:hypothetical protein